MSRFYFLVWSRWVVRVVLCSGMLSAFFSVFVTFVLYGLKGFPSLDENVIKALVDIFLFWFPITLSFTLLVALFRSLKYVFSKCLNGYEFVLFECNQTKQIQNVGYGDLVKVWRKWFVLLVWFVMGQVLVVSGLFFTFVNDVFSWFNIYWLVGFILSGGYVSFMLLPSRVKVVKIRKCQRI